MPRLVPELRPGRDQAQDSAIGPDPFTRKSTASLAGGSGGGPLGFGGFSFEYAPTKYTVLGAGAGISSSGITAAFMPRLRLPVTRWLAFGFGVPYSLGPYSYGEQVPDTCKIAGCAVGYRTTREWTLAHWAHLEPNIELRIPNGLTFRFYGGRSFILNAHDDECKSTLANGCPSNHGQTRWYGGLALGYSF